MKQKLHSQEYFGEPRDYWWNFDFLELMAKRWHLSDSRQVLDAGSGLGHWGQALAPFLQPDCKVIGIDRELAWVSRAVERANSRGMGGMFTYRQGDVTSLDFPDATFDLVTCQTVLIHVDNPRAVIQEFIRVLRPGGILAVVEPNNMASTLVLDSLCFADPIDKILDSVRFHLISQRGKSQLREGHNSIGDLLPGYFAQAGLRQVQTYMSDKATQMFAPYDTSEQRSIMKQIRDWQEREICFGDKDESRTYFLAGGGTSAEFDRLWQLCMLDDQDRFRASCQKGTFHTGGGGVMYLVSGVK